MGFDPSDFESLIRFLDEHPDLRDQLRRRILSDDFLRLPVEFQELREHVQAMAAAVERLEAAVERLGTGVERLGTGVERLVESHEALAKTQERTLAVLESLGIRVAAIETRLDGIDARFDQIDQRLDRMDARFDQIDQRLDRMDARFDLMDQRLDRMDARFDRIERRVGRLDGRTLEAKFWDRAPSYFGTILRRARVLQAGDLPELDAAVDDGRLSEQDYAQLLALDAIVRGIDKRVTNRPDTLLAHEVSVTIHEGDIRRAAERAALLRRAGFRALGAVGGEGIGQESRTLAEELDVAVAVVAGAA